MDRLTEGQRSANMSRIGSKNTKPELMVRSLTHQLGFRYRLHVKDLPGKPDLVFRTRRKVIFVHGCFWHQHDRSDCSRAHKPVSNLKYWRDKLDRNTIRDATNLVKLKDAGWEVMTIWECEAVEGEILRDRITAFLGNSRV